MQSKEALQTRYSDFQKSRRSLREKASGLVAEKTARSLTTISAFVLKRGLTTIEQLSLSIMNRQRRQRDLPPIGSGVEGATVSQQILSPERKRLLEKIMSNINLEQIADIGEIFLRRHPWLREKFGLPPLGRQQRELMETEFGITPPTVLIIDLTQRCNLSEELTCPHCFNDSRLTGTNIETETLKRLVSQCVFMGTHAIMFSGGEPFLLADSISQTASEFPAMLFFSFTNGLVLAEQPEIAKKLPGNLIPIVNITPAVYSKETTGTIAAQNRIEKAFKNLNNHIFFSSLAVERGMLNNPEKVNDILKDSNCVSLLLLPYMPVGKDSDPQLMVPENKTAVLGEFGRQITTVPLVLTEELLTEGSGFRCPAASRELGHALPSEGIIKACPFSNLGIPFDVNGELGLVTAWSKMKDLTTTFKIGCAMYETTR